MPIGDLLSPDVELICTQVVDAGFKVHDKMQPGLLESVYEACLFYELKKRGLRVERQVPVPVFYDGEKLDIGFRMDLLVEACVVIEVKAVETMNPVFPLILKNYLRLANKPVGFLMNFNVAKFKDGLKRIINN